MKVVIAYGTRPERIKLQTVARALEALGAEVVEWVSGQSEDLLGDGVLASPAMSYAWSWKALTLGENVSLCVDAFDAHLRHNECDVVIVQGDTATAFACALAAWLRGVPVAHVEAGMRTYAEEPWPEEGFRRMIAPMARWHFCPSTDEALNLLQEQGKGYAENAWLGEMEFTGIYVVGNTITDTLPRKPFRVLATLHRRESWGERIRSATDQLRAFAEAHEAVVQVVRHPNWARAFGDAPEPESNGASFVIVQPREDHNAFLEMLERADVVVTDSGGVQEEAAWIGKECLVVRKVTERVGLLEAGAVELVDPDGAGALTRALERAWGRRRVYGNGGVGAEVARRLYEALSTVAGAPTEVHWMTSGSPVTFTYGARREDWVDPSVLWDSNAKGEM